MQITAEDIRRFREIWREEFSEEIGADEAREHIARLDVLYLLLAQRPSKENGPAPPESEDAQST